MSKKRRMFWRQNRLGKQPIYSGLIVLAAVLFLSAAYSLWGVDEECDNNIRFEVKDSICIPSIPINKNYDFDCDIKDWDLGSYKEFISADQHLRVLCSHKKRELDKADLYLFFEVDGIDAVGTYYDEIRIGLNPGTDPKTNILIKYYPWGSKALSPVPDLKVYTYDGSKWNDSDTSWLTGNIGKDENNLTASWSVEMKIPLDMVPNPITGTAFRLYLELHSDDGTTTYKYAWPQHHNILGEHNYICVNPNRWHPMVFGNDCPDLDIANGVYSCDAIYILRDGKKSTDIYVDQDNEFHADVTNDSLVDAKEAKVYMTLSKFGIGAWPVAMNYDPNDASIKQWFDQRWGGFFTANGQLQKCKPPNPGSFNVGIKTDNTDKRFTWNPSEENENNFGTIAQMVDKGSHSCTAAFVYYKDDPYMENNLSSCNTIIVNAPTNQTLTLPFWLGPYFPYAHPQGAFSQRLIVTALNEPYPGWFKRAKFGIKGKGVKQISGNVFDVPTPEKGEIELEFELTTPYKYIPGSDMSGYIPGGETYVDGYKLYSSSKGTVTGNEMTDSDKRLKKIYGDRPIVLIEGYAPAGYKTGAKQERIQLYRFTSYAAFALDLQDSPVVSFRPYELTLFAGWTWWEDTLYLKDGPVVGAKLGYRWARGMTLELEAGLGFTKEIVSADQGNWLQLFGNLRYEIPIAGRLKPFVTAGAGIVMFKGFLHNDNTFAYQWGGGLIYSVTPTFGIRMDGRFLRLNKGLFGAAAGTTNFQGTAGLVFWF